MSMVALIALLIFSIISPRAQADMMELTPSLKSKKAVCCNEFDGRPPEAIWELSDGRAPDVHYKVKLEGQWVDVPDDAVLEQPNKYGVAVVWYSTTRGANGPGSVSFFIRCFLPGSLI